MSPIDPSTLAGWLPVATNPGEAPPGWFRPTRSACTSRAVLAGDADGAGANGRTEAQDPPPEPTWSGRLVPAAVAPAAGPADEDLVRAGDPGPDVEPGSQFGLLGDPGLPGTVGDAVTSTHINRGLPEFLQAGRVPPTPRRVVTYQLGGVGPRRGDGPCS